MVSAVRMNPMYQSEKTGEGGSLYLYSMYEHRTVVCLFFPRSDGADGMADP